MAIYIKFPNIEGNVSSEKHKNWVETELVNFGFKRNIKARVGNTVEQQNSIADFSEVWLYKKLDKATNELFAEFIGNKGIKTAEIHVCPTDEQPVAKYVLHNVFLSSQQHFISSDAMPTEEIRLNYSKIEMTYIGRDSANKPLSPTTTGYDLEKAQML